MKKLLISLGAILTLLLIVFVGLIAYVLTFDPNANKDWIAAKFLEETGRELVLGGNIEMTIYPWAGITADNVSIGNAPGFSATPLLQAEHLEARVKLMPLLNGSYEIDTVRLHGARVNLEVLGNGQNNWSSNEQAASARDASSGGPGVPSVIIGGVDIQDAAISYDDQLANTHYEVSNLDLGIGELVYGAPLDIRLSFDAAARAPQLEVTATVAGTVVYDVDNGLYTLEPLTLAATLRGPNVPTGSADIMLSAAVSSNVDEDTLSVRNLEFAMLDTHLGAGLEVRRASTETPAVTGNLHLTGDDLAVIFRIIEQEELAQRISSLNSRFNVTASVDADMEAGTINVPELQANLLGADINGTLNATRINTGTPTLNGKLTAAGPDLPTLVEVLGMLQGGSAGELTRIGRDLAQVPDKTFRVQTDFAADMNTGTLEVPEFYAALLGATINGNVSGTNIQTDAPQLRGQLNAQGPDLPLLMQIAGQLQGGRESELNQMGLQLRNGVRNRAFTLSTGFDADLAQGNIQLPALTATMLGFRVNGNLDASDINDGGSINGALDLQGDNLREVLTAIGQADLGEVAQSVKLDIAVSGSSSNLRISPLHLDLVLAGEQIPNSPQTLSFKGDTVLNLDNDSLRVDTFTLSGLGLNLTGNVSATNIAENAAFEGRIDVLTFNARSLLQQLNQPVDTADSTALTRVALNSAFKGNTNSLELDGLVLTLDQSNVTGSLALTDLTAMTGRFTVNVDSIDADRYLAPPVATDTPVATSEAEPLPVDMLKALNLQGAVNIGQLTITGLQMKDIVVELNAANGVVALNPIRANLYEGSFAGDISLDVTGAQPTAIANTTLTSIALGPLTQDFMEADYLTGTGNITLSLTGSGADSVTIKQSLSGSGSLGVTDGVLAGVDVNAVLRQVELMIRTRALQELPRGDTTAFDKFSATLAINNGVVSSNDLAIESPGWSVAGSGVLADLNAETINFNLVTSVDETTATSAATEYDLGGYTLPIACTGALADPSCLPDARQIIAGAVTSAVQRRLGDLIQERLGTTPQQGATPRDAAPTEDAPVEEETKPEQELLNRALDRLLR